MFQQPQAPAHPFTPQQSAYSSPPMSPAFGAAPQAQMPMVGFPVGPRPAVPVRSGAMRPPMALHAQAPPTHSPFGEALTPSNDILAPVNMQPDLPNGSTAKDDKPPYDPFGSLLPGMGTADKKDMFKNFKMAKPQSKTDLQQENTSPLPASNTNPNSTGDPFASMTYSGFGESLNSDSNKQVSNS